jgi:cytochrome b561
MNSLFVAHKHYGSLLLVLILAVIVVALTKGPKPVLQRIVAVLVDINLVVGIVAVFQVGSRNVSWLHPIFALGAVGLLHASAKSEDKAKVLRCFSIALLLLVAAWSVNASWGPSFFKDEKTGQPIFPIKSIPEAVQPASAK